MLVRSCFFYLSSVPYLDQEDFQTEQEISLFLFHQVSFSYARVLPSYHIYLLDRLVVPASVELSSICRRSLGKLITTNALKIVKKCTKIFFFFFWVSLPVTVSKQLYYWFYWYIWTSVSTKVFTTNFQGIWTLNMEGRIQTVFEIGNRFWAHKSRHPNFDRSAKD